LDFHAGLPGDLAPARDFANISEITQSLGGTPRPEGRDHWDRHLLIQNLSGAPSSAAAPRRDGL